MLLTQLTRLKVLILVILFSLLAMACVGGGGGDDSGSHDPASDRSSRLASSRASARDSSSHGSARSTDAPHGAAAAEHAAPSHGSADSGHGAADTGHGAASSGNEGNGEAPHWAYDGDLGPSHWGDLADQFAVCASGSSQSPINISNVIEAHPSDIEFNYHSVPLSILNNGHTLQVNYAPGSSITIDHKEYELLQFHFHTPSEHQLAAHNFPMEGHLVHKNSHDELAVVGVFIEEGHANPFFQTLVEHLPSHAGEEKLVTGVEVNSMDLLPHETTLFNYSGSLTTPPCSEGVNWNVMSTPIQASSEQLHAFSAIMGNNNRPVQQMHSRLVSGQPNEGDHLAAASTHGDSGPVDSGHGTAIPDGDHADPAHWEYEGGPGQWFWGDLSADFTSCVDGSAQSPINVSNAVPTPLKDIEFHYQPAQVEIKNNGHTVQASYGRDEHGEGGYITVDGTEYKLLQFHYHWPSEHTVAGKQYFMEMHLVHQDDHGNLAVVGVLMDRGAYNSGLEPVWDVMPATTGEVRNPEAPFNVESLLPDDRRTFRYPGSLTKPPCSEGVKWLLMQTPMEVSSSQVQVFKDVVGYNARYVQPLHGREVLEDISID